MIDNRPNISLRFRLSAFAGITVLFVLFVSPAYAAKAKPAVPVSPPVESLQLQKCLKRADDMPDIASVEASAWIKKKGGNDAHLCRAFAQANRGMHADAAREFWYLASYYDKHDKHRGVSMHNFSGREFMLAKDTKNAEAQFMTALKKEPDNADALMGRAQTRMAQEKYWDALDDLNKALKSQPDNIDALRQRGSVWAQLGSTKNAQEDFNHADELTDTQKH